MRDLAPQDKEKPGVRSDVCLNLHGKCSSHSTRATGGKGREWEKEKRPTVEEDQGREGLRDLKGHKSMGPNEMHPWVQRELAEKVAWPLSIIFEKSWQSSGVLMECKRGNITSLF
ncbi:RNA-directed DNA polymerase from mobile element jockey [Pitangus sulphuratus]|nr:RNA-directed DNA polymerase from mobile element jockey [Pitangus sulphuratus]